ncbi:Anaphase-promoting complex subunit 23 [Serendipita sp. 411]|nr:Anaphase-promoting complex subunit 23 [Serendipita sp. 411]
MFTLDVQAVASLRQAIDDCNDRGLLAASKWAADLLQYVPPGLRAASLDLTSHYESDPETNVVRREEDQLRTARSFFASKEYARAAHTLELCVSTKARFLALYIKFLMSERKAYEDFERAIRKHQYGARTGPKDYPRQPRNSALASILDGIQRTKDPFLLFLKGLILHRLNRRDEAIESLILSVTAYPWNWSTWEALSRCIKDRIELAKLRHLLPSHLTQLMFQVYSALEREAIEDEDLDECNRILTIIPDCPMVIGWKAQCLYILKDLEEAELLFDQLLVKDPFRIEGIDVYSAILYVLRKKTKLSKLARRFSSMSRDRPEVCCVIGDHYSIRGEHDKAIKYYRRAVLLDPNCVGAWTLLGHAFLELKNAHAAIESYRRAIDMSPQDPRGWFGLGQAYALLCMFQYSLYYYQRAVALKPLDARIWQELSTCYGKINKQLDAAECLKRALAVASRDDTTINLKLATLYEALNDNNLAASYHAQHMETCERLGKGVPEYAKSCIFVAKHYATTGQLKDLEFAITLFQKIANSNAEDNQLAKEALPKLEAFKRTLGK